jgi:subfamily B ATP-binding cassette protein MsbA
MSGPGPSALVPQKPSRRERLRDLLPDLLAIVGPRRWLLVTGFVLIGLSRLASMAPLIATKFLIDDVLAAGKLEELPVIVGAVMGASLFNSLTGFTLTQLFSRSTTRLIGELRCKLESHVLRLSLLYHDSNQSGALASRIMNDVQGLQNLVGTGILNFLGSLMTALIAVALMARMSPALTLIALAMLIALGTVVARGTRRVRDIAHERTQIQAETMGRLTESLGGVRVIKAYRAEPREEQIFAGSIARLVQNLLRTVTLASRLNLITSLLWGATGAVVLWIGAHRILDHRLKLGEFMTFTGLLNLAVAPIQAIVGVGSMLMEALAGLERTREILRTPREDLDPRREVDAGPLQGSVVFEDVTFAYAPDKPVLKGFSFEAAPGTVTALVGPSGSGKSTTIGLIASFYAATGGRVLVDGRDITTLKLESYRAQLGVVLQESFLFAGTILENVAFAKPGATRDEILAACRSARVDEFAEKLADGYDTMVGERGVMLSGGQRQRISIARALLADPRILILDEATSSLDTHSEALIQEALSRLLVGRTTFVIAHRLSTIRAADQILVVDGGQIRERGTHAALMTSGGLYAEMYTKQHKVEDNLFLAPGEGGAPEQATKAPALGPGEDPVGVTLPVV